QTRALGGLAPQMTLGESCEKMSERPDPNSPLKATVSSAIKGCLSAGKPFMEPISKRLHHAPSTLRNREPILAVLMRVLPAKGVLLEVASGSGEHAAFITPRLPLGLEWQPSEANVDALADIDAYASNADCSRIRPAILLNASDADWPVQSAEAVFCCNMIHIAPWEAAEGLFAGSSRILANAAPLILYGPFKRDGLHTAPSNQTFDEGLRARDPRW